MLDKKSINAVNALVVMACMPEGDAITAAELAGQMRLSVSYTEGLLKVLRENGFIRATRGPGGGYDLAKPAHLTSVWSVVQVLDPRAPSEPDCQDPQIDLERILGRALDARFEEVLSSCFIGDYIQARDFLPTRSSSKLWGFGLKPLAPRWMPDAPNSVFQLSQFVGEPASAWAA